MSLIDTLDLPPRNLPPPPAYRQPVLVTTYSHLPDRHIEAGDESMAYYRPGGAALGSDLSYGLDRRIERGEIEEHLDGLVDSIRRAGGLRPGGVVSWRGMMTRIMAAPFETNEGWEMDAVALDGSVYLEEHVPPEVRAKKLSSESRWALPSYMGYAYEAYSTLPADGEEVAEDAPEGWSGDVNTNVQWCNVVRSAIGDIPLYLGGEVDCVKAHAGAPNPGLDACVELKTNKVIDSDRADAIFQKKLLKHWAQSFLLGVPTVEVGFRTEAGILQANHGFDTASIPALVAVSERPAWHPAPSLHFLYAALSLLTRHILPSDPAPSYSASSGELPPAPLWRLRFTPRRGVELLLIGEVPVQNDRWAFLPEDYVRWRLGSP